MLNRGFVLAAVILFTFSAPTLAQEKYGDTRVYHTIKSEAVPIPDQEGHVLVLTETRGYDLQRHSNAVNRYVLDLVKGSGRAFGYGAVTETDGDVLYYTIEGKVTTAAGSTGKPSTTAEGTWTSTGGTGKWKDREARGTWKSAVVGPDTSLTEWEGTWQPKK
jgi:hypothetical protein